MSGLAHVSTDELIEELARRRNQPDWAELESIRDWQWCEDCTQFRFAKSNAEADARNPCTLGHKMSFRMPHSPNETEWGFYRRVCADRQPRPRADR